MMMNRGVTKKKSPLNSTTPTGLVLNKRELRNFTSIAHENRNVEFLYLRENEFTDFHIGCELPQLKVLDLSINNLTGPMQFMADTPHLRHLYLTGNRIASLEGFSLLAELETLCLSDNDINSFEFFGEWPNLRVLSLNFNQIENFMHYGYLPQLRTLNLRGNPVSEHASYRQMAIAASSPSLQSIDMEEIADDERQQVDFFRGKIQFCIGEGMVVEGDQPEAQADRFVYELNQKNAPQAALALHHISVVPVQSGTAAIIEGAPVQLQVCLQDTRPYADAAGAKFHSQHIFPVTFQVRGEAKEVFLVGEVNRWADPIPLERRTDEDDGEVVFSTTLYLPTGDYEYRYIVDGDEKLSEGHVASKHGQGQCNIHTVKETAKFENQQTILHIRWTRSNESGGYDEVPGENSLVLVPRSEDIGFCYRAEVIAYYEGDFSFLYFDISTPVCAGPPACRKIALEGAASEGSALVVAAEYSGGVEGRSLLQWFRVTPEGDEIVIEREDPWALEGYACTLEDVGCSIKVVYTPVRDDNETGAPASATSAPVSPGVPSCVSLRITGDSREGGLLTAEAEYCGGYEGSSRFQWYRLDEPTQEYVAIAGESGATYTCTLADVGKTLAIAYTPVSQHGVEGDAQRCACDEPIAAAPPTVSDVVIRGQCVEEAMLTVEWAYSGGYAGMPLITWYAEKTSTSLNKTTREKIGRSNHSTCTLTRSEVGARIVVSVVPVRDDEAKGHAVEAAAEGLVQAGEPQVRDLRVRPEQDPPVKGTVVAVEFTYFGGTPGDHEIVWQTAKDESWTDVANHTKKYVIAEGNLGHMLRVAVTPIRSDGARGEVKMRMLELPAAPEPEPEPERAATPVKEKPAKKEEEPAAAAPAAEEPAAAAPAEEAKAEEEPAKEEAAPAAAEPAPAAEKEEAAPAPVAEEPAAAAAAAAEPAPTAAEPAPTAEPAVEETKAEEPAAAAAAPAEETKAEPTAEPTAEPASEPAAEPAEEAAAAPAEEAAAAPAEEAAATPAPTDAAQAAEEKKEEPAAAATEEEKPAETAAAAAPAEEQPAAAATA